MTQQHQITAFNPSSQSSLSVPEKYALFHRHGFSFFPLDFASKIPPKGFAWSEFQTRKPSIEEMRRWYAKDPATNTAVVTGRISGIVVVDLDGSDGRRAFERFNPSIDTPSVRTKKGEHLYYRYPDFSVTNFVRGKSGSDFLPQVDLRADGGYVVAPGSRHPQGLSLYKWARSPDQVEFAELPRLFQEYLQNSAKIVLDKSSETSFKIGDKLYIPMNEDYVEIECDKIRSAPEGTRNSELNKVAFHLGTYAVHDAESMDRVHAALTAAALDAGLGAGEIASTIHSGLAAGISKSAERDPETDWKHPSQYTLSEFGNAARLCLRHPHDIRYNSTRDRWMVWDGNRWVDDEHSKVVEFTKDSIRQMRDDIPASNSSHADAIAKWSKQSQASSKVNATLALAKSEAGISIVETDLDKDLWSINLRNGLLDLRTFELHPHSPEHLVSRIANVEYDPAALCTSWDGFLSEIFEGDDEMIEHVQKVIGQTLCGDRSEQSFFLSHGAGANGKSTFINTILDIMGDYSCQTQFDSFAAKQNQSVRNDLARMAGRRLVVAHEGTEGTRIDESLLKQLTGGDPITARFLFQEYFEFTPTFVIWLVTNNKPIVRGSSHGFWRRVRVLPFSVVIPEEKQDKRLREKLMAESSGILNWMLRGFKAWQETGLTPPKKVQEASEDYRVEMDLLGRFFDECCVLDPSKSCKSSDLYAAYSTWADECGEHPLGNRVFGMRLKERGFLSKRGTGGIHRWVGIELKTLSQSLDSFLRDCCVVDSSRSCLESTLYAAFTNWTGRSSDEIPSQWLFGKRAGELGFSSKKDASGRVVWSGLDLTDEFRTPQSGM